MKKKYIMPFGTITVHSKEKDLCDGIIESGAYRQFFSVINYNIYIGWDFENIDITYRATQMQKGIYLGHNIGISCKLHINGNDIHLYTSEKKYYKKIFWSFVIKFIFTKVCLDNNILHIKGTILCNIKDGDIILLLGKGGSGKTTLADELSKQGFNVLSNTHCMIDGEYVWGINSWIRRRKGNKEIYELEESKKCFLDGYLKKCLLVEGGNNKMFNKHELMMDEKYYYIKNFSAAISNYDLKEEVCDYMTDCLEMTVNYLKREDDLVKEFAKIDIHKIILNSFEKNHLDMLLDIIN